MAPVLAHEKIYTIVDIYSLPKDSRAELIETAGFTICPSLPESINA